MDYRIIIFEGNECTGKSTLKQKFESATNFRQLCVDRMFVTSIVYNEYKGRHPDLKEKLLKDLDVFIKTFNPLFVVLKTDEQEQEKRFVDRKDWYIKIGELRKIQEKYDAILEDLVKAYPQNFLILYNNNEEDQDRIIERIKEECK